MNFDKTDLRENTLIITNDDGSITCIPEEGCTADEKAMFDEFRVEYPDGKPQPVVEQQPLVPSQEDYLLDLDYRLSLIELGV